MFALVLNHLSLSLSLSASQPCTKSLRELNISYNRCGDNGLYMLKLGLLANRSLEKLNLCQVKMTDEGKCPLVPLFNEHLCVFWWLQMGIALSCQLNVSVVAFGRKGFTSDGNEPSARMRSEGYSSWVVCLSVCLSFTQHLTSQMFFRLTNHTTYVPNRQ